MHLRRLASPLLKRGGFRLRTTKAEPNFRSSYGYKPFWNSGRVLLFSTATGMTTYFYGANDETTRFQIPWRRAPGPQYASKREMERVGSSVTFMLQNTECPCRQSTSCGRPLEKTRSVPMMKICTDMDIQNGLQLILINCQLRWPIPSQQRKSPILQKCATNTRYQ
jgi:hypothetical protein